MNHMTSKPAPSSMYGHRSNGDPKGALDKVEDMEVEPPQVSQMCIDNHVGLDAVMVHGDKDYTLRGCQPFYNPAASNGDPKGALDKVEDMEVEPSQVTTQTDEINVDTKNFVFMLHQVLQINEGICDTLTFYLQVSQMCMDNQVGLGAVMVYGDKDYRLRSCQPFYNPFASNGDPKGALDKVEDMEVEPPQVTTQTAEVKVSQMCMDNHVEPEIEPPQVTTIGTAKDRGRFTVGGFTLDYSSIRELIGNDRLPDEVIDSYLHLLLEKQRLIFHMDAAVANALFTGKHESLQKMTFPMEDMLMCPVNLQAHWILVIVNMSKKIIEVIDPLKNERRYEKEVMQHWREFLKMMGRSDSSQEWCFHTFEHNLQKDSSSCGVLILMFAREYLRTGAIRGVETNENAISHSRMQIAYNLMHDQSGFLQWRKFGAVRQTNNQSALVLKQVWVKGSPWGSLACDCIFVKALLVCHTLR
ncbi:uncharacterized protein LOC143121837 isoform X4 [Alosa pseudoharengus]|uniref:uncharacterized protein LOC143121837 isoform X4 n=1 Tax=Alosa pseudoharengus TaxID=34774 RepID=UPI003F8AEE73